MLCGDEVRMFHNAARTAVVRAVLKHEHFNTNSLADRQVAC